MRERAYSRPHPIRLDLESDEIRQINWWSLRKAGFDCRKPVDPHRDPDGTWLGNLGGCSPRTRPCGFPSYGSIAGNAVGPQHIVRVAAYCQLIKSCELADAPFGLLMFAGSYDCLAIPHTAGAQLQFEKAVEDVREFLRLRARPLQPAAPTDDRCSGCHCGHLREHVAGRTDTILNGERVVPYLMRSPDDRLLHCTCGDRFKWTPPHDTAVRLGIAVRNESTS